MLGMASVLPESRRDWVQLAANGLWFGPAVIVCVLACRRLAGAFSEGMADAAICFVASGISVLVLLSVTLGQLTRDENQDSDTFWQSTALHLSPAMIVGWLLLVSPSVATIAFLTVQAITVGAVGWAVTRIRPDVLAEMVREFSADATCNPLSLEQPALKVATDLTTPDEDDELFHEMTRRHLFEDETGWDVLQGVLTVDFQPNQRKVALHIPICPPMDHLPETECAVLGDEMADVAVSSVHPYGVRLEVRRPATDGTTRVRLEYTIAGEITPATKHVA